MSTIRIRPRSAIADADLARTAVVDLPRVFTFHRPHTPQAIARAIASLLGPIEPDRVIVMPLVPVPAEIRGR
ncbi:MAG TPA: hypothetical protein VD763_02400 [Candidatus Saccharimonadales bacterium]|nr:hypothetical protein [Candidatus Saccharimonadales bacterium]